MNLIALAIPFFFCLIAIEFLVARFQNKKVFRFADAITNLSCGITQQLLGVFVEAAIFAVYVWLYSKYHLIEFETAPAALAIGGFVLLDMAYYWWHRTSHRVHFVWATHVPHHQSEDYNLAVALRQAAFSRFTSAPFYWPLAFLGVPPGVFATCLAINTIYQFWIHTETISKMGPLEWILNTPSHHRVHHGINPLYIDRNHAGVFIVWDKLFGTFQEELEKPVYGIVAPHRSWNPVWANFSHWAYLWEIARKTNRWSDKIRIWFMPPEWKPEDFGGVSVVPPVNPGAKKFDTEPVSGCKPYVAGWFVFSVIATTWLLAVELPQLPRIVIAVSILLLLVSLSALLEGKKNAVAWEGARLVSFLGAGLLLMSFATFSGWSIGLLLAMVLASTVGLVRIAVRARAMLLSSSSLSQVAE